MALWSLPLIYAVPFGKMRHGGGTLSDGLSWGFGNRDTDPASVPAWVGRAERAGRNHFENLPMFAILVLVLHVSGKHDDVTGWAAVAFCVARVLHAVLYWNGVTVLGVRTGAYYGGMGALLVMLSRLI